MLQAAFRGHLARVKLLSSQSSQACASEPPSPPRQVTPGAGHGGPLAALSPSPRPVPHPPRQHGIFWSRCPTLHLTVRRGAHRARQAPGGCNVWCLRTRYTSISRLGYNLNAVKMSVFLLCENKTSVLRISRV